MNILLIGSGGREHALAWAIAKSPLVSKLYIAPGNAGTANEGENVDLDLADHPAVVAFVKSRSIDLTVIGPDAPAVAGLGSDLREEGLLVFGPGREAAQLEGSKSFTKALCDKMAIPTAAYRSFNNEAEALDYVRQQGAPIVIKADGLALGKGVVVAETLAQAQKAVRDCFSGRFGDAGSSVVIEEFLEGEEASIFAISDGEHHLLLPSVQDHKQAFDGDKGPNTGGMGAYSPAPVVTPDLLARIDSEIITPAISGMKARGTPFSGVLFTGIMVTPAGPKLIEFNVRFGDPEAQVLMLRLKSDLVPLLLASARGDISGVDLQWRDDAAVTVVLAAKGYPGAYGKGSLIRQADAFNADNVRVFHAGTSLRDNELTAAGGRVLAVTALGTSIGEAAGRAYETIARIDWPEGFCRRDIGWRAIARERIGS